MPFFSVLIPTYNGERFIEETVESVLKQTFTDFEIIIVNDGSNDTTGQIIAKLKKKDARIKIITTSNSGIPAATTNVGVDAAKGNYIAFLDHDDIWKHHKLMALYDTFTKNPEVGFIISNVEVLDEKDKSITVSTAPIQGNKLSSENVLSGNYFNTFSMLAINREVIDKIGYLDTNFFVFADFEIIIRMVSRSIPFLFLEEPLVTYRIHQNNTSTIVKSGNKRIKDLESIITKYENLFHGHKNSKSKILRTIARLYLYIGEKQNAIIYFEKALAYDKFNPASYMRLFLSWFGERFYDFFSTLKNKIFRKIT